MDSDRVFLQAVRCLAPAHEVTVVLDNGGPLQREIEALGVQCRVRSLGVVRRGRMRPARILGLCAEQVGAVRWLRGVVRSEGVDVVYSSTSVVVTGAVAAWLAGTPHVWHIHEIVREPKALVRALKRMIGRLSARVIAVSRAGAEWLSDSPGARPDRVIVVHNPLVRLCEEAVKTSDIRSELSLPARAQAICMVGRINPGKGQGVLVDAIARMKTEGREDLVALVLGDAYEGSEGFVEDLRQQIRAQGVEDSVRLLGYREDSEQIMRSSDLVVVPSVWEEPFGLVALEAMDLGKAVVASATGGLLEIVEDGVTGLLVPPGDPGALAEALDRLLEDGALRAEMGRRGQERARSLFTSERFCAGVTKVIAEAGRTP